LFIFSYRYWTTHRIINQNKCSLHAIQPTVETRGLFGGLDRKNLNKAPT
jgi:hypothetical protein